MPSSRRLKVTGLVILLTVLIVLYITQGASTTHNSPFYTRTVAAIQQKESAAARSEVIAAERQRQERVDKIQREHDKAVADAANTPLVKAGVQKPLVAEDHDAITGQKVTDKVKPVAGRKIMKDDRIYPGTPAEGDDDGVAKVGNIEPKATSRKPKSGADDASSTTEKTAEEHQIDAELNDILKKGPIIIFSKSYCPHSQKAKHILQDLYDITPAPFVVELDHHPLGPGLQDALRLSTGRRTVPNVLINGRSIGGGDDVQKLHADGNLIDTVQSMGGRRVSAVLHAGEGQGDDASAKKGLRFKA